MTTSSQSVEAYVLVVEAAAEPVLVEGVTTTSSPWNRPRQSSSALENKARRGRPVAALPSGRPASGNPSLN